LLAGHDQTATTELVYRHQTIPLASETSSACTPAKCGSSIPRTLRSHGAHDPRSHIRPVFRHAGPHHAKCATARFRLPLTALTLSSRVGDAAAVVGGGLRVLAKAPARTVRTDALPETGDWSAMLGVLADTWASPSSQMAYSTGIQPSTCRAVAITACLSRLTGYRDAFHLGQPEGLHGRFRGSRTLRTSGGRRRLSGSG
jgi:hypothetical protein